MRIGLYLIADLGAAIRHVLSYHRSSHHRSSYLADTHGVAAAEFALMLPVLLVLSLSGYELSRYLLIYQKIEKIAYSMADVTAQSESLTQADLNLVFAGAAQIMQPYAFGADGVVILSSVYQNGTVNPPTVRWQRTGGGTLARTSQVGTVNGTATLPGGIALNDRDNVIVAEVYYRFEPLLSGTLFNAIDFYATATFKPRLGALTTAPS